MALVEKTKCYAFDTDTEVEDVQLDIFTAASIGDVSYFTKYVSGSTGHFSASNESGWTPIMYACARGHALLVSYLIMCGVRTDCITKSKVTPLMLAISSGDLATVESVFSVSDMESKDYRMWTPLFYAVFFLQEKCVEFLLRNGADVNIADFQNETPLILALKSGNELIIDLLLRTACNLEVQSYRNESAIMLAKQASNRKIRDMIFNRKDYLEMGRNGKWAMTTRQEKSKMADKENCYRVSSPSSRSPKVRSFLRLKMTKSFSYSPNNNAKLNDGIFRSNSPVQTNFDFSRTPFWKMCVSRGPDSRTALYNVETLLSSLGLEKYWPIFRDEEVDFETLLTFSDENLKELGITLFGPRKKILSAINHLRMYNER